jgi:hypothetical protein
MTGLQYMSQAKTPQEKANVHLDFETWINWLYPSSSSDSVY